jgi:hypothetical protein
MSMRYRCTTPSAPNYHVYGGRGISVCAEWEDFVTFRNWALANGYQDNLSIERVDNDGDYCPENCTWISMSEQARNRRTNRMLTAFGETKYMRAWTRDERCQAGYSNLLRRIKRGWSSEEAISLPPDPHRTRVAKARTDHSHRSTRTLSTRVRR